MTTFTDVQQAQHRQAFIDECRQKAWGARCHAEWIGKGLDRLLLDYEKLLAEDHELGENIKKLDLAVDSHTKDNRLKRKELQERRNAIAKTTKALALNMQEGQKAMQGLHQGAESNLSLAAHAEEWQWKDSEAQGLESAPAQ